MDYMHRAIHNLVIRYVSYFREFKKVLKKQMTDL